MRLRADETCFVLGLQTEPWVAEERRGLSFLARFCRSTGCGEGFVSITMRRFPPQCWCVTPRGCAEERFRKRETRQCKRKPGRCVTRWSGSWLPPQSSRVDKGKLCGWMENTRSPAGVALPPAQQCTCIRFRPNARAPWDAMHAKFIVRLTENGPRGTV